MQPDVLDEPVVLLDLEVVNWRFEQLEDAGYPIDVALALAGNPDVDLHGAVDLISSGASVHQALLILL